MPVASSTVRGLVEQRGRGRQLAGEQQRASPPGRAPAATRPARRSAGPALDTRRESRSQRSSSHRREATTQASHSQCGSSSAAVLRIGGGQRLPQRRQGGGVPRVRAWPGRRGEGRAAAAGARRAGAAAAARATSMMLPPGLARRPGEHHRRHRGQVGGAGQADIDPLQPLGSPQQQQRGFAVPASGGCEPGPAPAPPRLLQVARAVRSPPEPAGPGAAPAAPAWTLTWAAASACPARRAGSPGQQRRALQERGRRGYAAPSLRPARRPFELGGHLLIRDQARPAPDGRPADPDRATARSPRPAPRAVAAARPAAPTGRRPNGPADAGPAPGRRTRPEPVSTAGRARPDTDAQPVGGLPRSARSPDGSAAASCSSRRVWAGRASSWRREAILDPAGQRPDGWQAEPARQLGRDQLPGSSSSASGFPRVSATIRSRTRASSGPARADSSSARAWSSCSPLSPARVARPVRRADREPRTPTQTGSAASRRATNPSVCSEARSSHRRRRSGRSAAGLRPPRQQAEHGQPD